MLVPNANAATPVVAFDESGNTGDNLLDETQPVCSLASVHVDPDHARALLDEALPRGRQELHFARLRRSREGRQAIQRVLSSALLTPQTARVTPMHKPFAVVARLFDYLIEPTIFERGHDVFAAGLQRQFPDALYRRGPTACGAGLWRDLLEAFVGLMRAPEDDEHLEDFMRKHRSCLIAAGHPLVRLMLEDVPDKEEVGRLVRIEQPAGIGGRDLLDPVPTMLVENCITWPDRLGSSIRIVHDENNVVRRWIPLIRALSQPNAAGVVGAYWSARMPLPLQVDDVTLMRSHDSPAVQIADIVGGASITWLMEQLSPGGQWAELAADIEATGLPAFIENEVWPLPTTPFSRFR